MDNNKTNFQTTVYTGTVNGKKQFKHVRAASKRQLQAKTRKLKTEQENGKNIYIKALFGEWAEKWLNETVVNNVSEGTLTEYKAVIKHINSRFEYVSMKNIKLSDFVSFINELAANNPNTNKPGSKKLLSDIKRIGASIFRYAIANDVSGISDFFRSVRIPNNAPQGERRALSEKEQQWIIDTPHRAQTAAMIMMFAGLRRGEVLALRWSDIDFKRRFISVNKSVNFVDNSPVLKDGGKTKNATRIVPMPPILVDYLKAYRDTFTIIPTYVCPNKSGRLHTQSSWKSMWDSYLIDLNIKYGYGGKVSKHSPKYHASSPLPMKIEPFTAHYLRHTYATILYLQGVNLETAKQYLGHSDITVTSNIYTHCDQTINKALISDEYAEKLMTIYSVA